MEYTYLIRRIRVLATLLVILWHSMAAFTMWDVAQHPELTPWLTKVIRVWIPDTMLPSFFIISGWLFYEFREKYKDVSSMILKKFDRIVIPAGIVFYITHIIPPNFEMIHNMEIDGHTWFLIVLFWCFFFTSFMIKKINVHIIALIGVLCYGLYRYMPAVMLLDMFMKYYIWFTLGMLCTPYISIVRNMPLWVSIVCLFVYVAALYFNISVFAILAYNLLVLRFFSNAPIKYSIIDNVDKASFGIYIFHQLIIGYLLCVPFINDSYKTLPIITSVFMYIAAFGGAFAITMGLKKIGFKHI